MSPEQARGVPVDKRADIWAYCVVLYEMLTGRRAFQGETKLSTIMAIVQKDPPPVSEILDHAHPEAEKIIARCLQKDRQAPPQPRGRAPNRPRGRSTGHPSASTDANQFSIPPPRIGPGRFLELSLAFFWRASCSIVSFGYSMARE